TRCYRDWSADVCSSDLLASMVRRVGNELIPNGGPGLGIDQRRMLAGVELALVNNLTDVDGVRQQMVDVSAGEGFAAALGAARRRDREGVGEGGRADGGW